MSSTSPPQPEPPQNGENDAEAEAGPRLIGSGSLLARNLPRRLAVAEADFFNRIYPKADIQGEARAWFRALL